MGQARSFFIKYQLVIFFLLAYALSWWTFPILGGAIFPQGPALAAIIVLAAVAGRKGLADLWRQVSKWRVSWTWYLVAPGIIVAVHLGALLLNLLLGAQVTSTAHLQPWTLILPVIGQLLLFGGQWEEPGWSGYALPYLQQRFTGRAASGVLLASLVLAFFRALWHLPLVLAGSIPWYDFIFYSLALQIFITWTYNRTRGSVLIVMLLHLFSNVMPRIMLPLFGGSDQERYFQLFVLLAFLAAIGFVLVTKQRLGLQPGPAEQPVGESFTPA